MLSGGALQYKRAAKLISPHLLLTVIMFTAVVITLSVSLADRGRTLRCVQLGTRKPEAFFQHEKLDAFVKVCLLFALSKKQQQANKQASLLTLLTAL